MIPMADNFNHSDVHVTFDMITKSLHLQADETCSYFQKSKFMNDYSTVFNDLEQTNENLLNVYGRFSKQQFESNLVQESKESIMAQMLELDIWEVDCERDRCFEDNDTEDDEDEGLARIQKALDKFSGTFVALPEKLLPQNIYATWLRKNCEYIYLHDNPVPVRQKNQFSWYDAATHDKESYFAMVNTNRRSLQPGE